MRVVNPKTAPVSIEVKWADYWTLQELYDGLEAQLVGKYLRAHNSQYGIYVMGHNGKKQHWIDSTTNNKLEFEQVVEIIRQRTIVLMKTNPRIGGLEVFGIDFRDPSKKRS